MHLEPRPIGVDQHRPFAADQQHAVRAAGRMAGPAVAAGGNRHGQAVVQRTREQPEVFDVVFLVLLKEVVGGGGVDGLELLAGQPANQADRVDADVVQLALGSCELVVARRELLLATPSERGGPGAPLPEEEVGVDTGQAAQPPGRHEVDDDGDGGHHEHPPAGGGHGGRAVQRCLEAQFMQ